jgi:predicted DNA-binding transcriptional regulator YafY
VDKTKLRHDLFLRYQFLEIIAYWEGRLTANHLMDTFDISRQLASKTINDYIKQFAPNNLIYDATLKGYKASNDFTPILSTGRPDEYLMTLHQNSHQPGSAYHAITLKPTNCEVLQPPNRLVDPRIVRSIVQACQDKMRIEVDYASMRHPQIETRVIAPHTLVFTGARWHTRAYCEKNKGFRDFVLSRFFGIPDSVTESETTSEDDTEWNTLVKLVIKPDPRLSSDQKKVISREYGMQRGALRLTERGPLVKYKLQLLQIDDKVLKGKGASQQIIVENLEEIQKWLF